ncbi:uncharacterized protein ACHE_21232A [Aspergillus chevalieri]|uniref:NACHT domain-containing protein n=1 Tax=Aspergillus chevalieri TaxID=182096 RepID=A0A7R7ZLM8_ASPCH|nr:uncharacterized protein ACHE_21232A [Aspergillus chevalieri]BCR85774.1 hypothetical protein ACHE_21232A [Aspergillus chevalieri]
MIPHIDIQGNIAQPGATQINNVIPLPYNTINDIDRSCLRALRCPDTLVVKNRLIENKDKLLPQSIEWIRENLHYKRWQTEDDVGLLWIKGGPGKGKTMTSIGLIEQFLQSQDDSTAVTYFFCQNADYELNTLAAIIKGLILHLVHQQNEPKESLRRRWDTVNGRFEQDVTSWRALWDIFMEMLYNCKCPRVYVIVDALDECRDESMTDFLKLLVRTGLNHPSKVKWVLTSRALGSAEGELLIGHDLVQVSLDDNFKQTSKAITTYIAFKVGELTHRHGYGTTLQEKIKRQLTEKAEGTYLWICRKTCMIFIIECSISSTTVSRLM